MTNKENLQKEEEVKFSASMSNIVHILQVLVPSSNVYTELSQLYDNV
jgi:hypothetical protein